MNRNAEQPSTITEHYTRESFVLFAKLVCDRLQLDAARRRKVFDLFLDLQEPALDHNPIDEREIEAQARAQRYREQWERTVSRTAVQDRAIDIPVCRAIDPSRCNLFWVIRRGARECTANEIADSKALPRRNQRP